MDESLNGEKASHYLYADVKEVAGTNVSVDSTNNQYCCVGIAAVNRIFTMTIKYKVAAGGGDTLESRGHFGWIDSRSQRPKTKSW